MTELSRDEEYQITSKHLTGLTALRKFANTKDYEWLETVVGQLSSIVEEKREAFEFAKMEAEEREKERQKAIKLVEEMGFSVESLLEPITVSTKKVKKAKKNTEPKYRFTDPITGKVDTWTGVGRMKKGLQSLINNGRSLEEFLITSTHENHQ